MKEILFKGKRKDNKQWVEGAYYRHPISSLNLSYIVVHDYHSYEISSLGNAGCPAFIKVIPETVSQFTGLYCTKDKNSKIFENDIVEITLHNGSKYRYLVWFCQEVCEITAINIENIEFNEFDYYENRGNAMSIGEFSVMIQDHYGHIKEVKVVGNVFDNPELLERKEN